MSLLETFLLVSITGTALVVLISSWHAHPVEFFSPRVFFTAMILYYTVIGPLVYLLRFEVDVLGVYVRPVMWKGWLVSLTAYAAFLVGYAVRIKRFDTVRIRTDDHSVFIVSVIFFSCSGYAMLYWIIYYGGGWSFLRPTFTEESALSAFRGFEQVGAVYLLQLINLSFGAVCLLLLYAIDKASILARVLFVLTALFSVMFFLKTGFRYRLAWLVVGLVVTYYLWHNKRPSPWLIGIAGAAFILIMGFIGLTRNYYGGLSLDRIEGTAIEEFFFSGFEESGTFLFLSQVVDMVPRDLPHTTWDPIWIALTYPIPRTFWPDKPVSQTLETLAASFGSNEAYNAGMAVPYYGEWYIAFGWIGVILSSIILGFTARLLWDWYHGHERDKFALVIYAVGLGFMYVAFSRGLLAQAALNFSFSLLPLIIIYKLLPKIRTIVADIGASLPGVPIPPLRDKVPKKSR